MQKPSKKKIIGAYNRLVKESGGKLVGTKVFMRETGFSPHYWRGGYWRSWSAFQADAGYTPNLPTDRIPDEVLLRRFAELALEIGSIPTQADLKLKRKEDSSFPSDSTYRRWGSLEALLTKVSEFCEEEDQFAPVFDLLKLGTSNSLDRRLESNEIKGFVYLLPSGKS
ncbi:MAG: hypothetical protein WC828_08285 [Thermoleophilia bacterium]|jgi:hypothetical protein